jgi:hypothetical protein
MQISATTAYQPITTTDRTAASAQSQAKVQDAATKLKAAEQDLQQPKVFTPAPPLRPNVQDYVDINRTLLSLRQVKT